MDAGTEVDGGAGLDSSPEKADCLDACPGAEPGDGASLDVVPHIDKGADLGAGPDAVVHTGLRAELGADPDAVVHTGLRADSREDAVSNESEGQVLAVHDDE